MAESSRAPSPSRVSSAASSRPRTSSSSTTLLTERLTLVHPTDLTPVEAANLKDEEADRLIVKGDLDGALLALQKAIFFRPDYPLFHAKLARVYWELCDLKSAMACYRKLFSIDPNPAQRIKDQFASLLDLHAYSLLMLGETPAVAIAYLTEAIQLNSLEETFWLHRAIAHIHSNCLDKALKDVDHCVNLNGREVEYFVLRAKLHWRLHMHEKATQDIHKAARLMPHHPEVVAHEQRLRNESQTIYAQACQFLLARKYPDAIKCLTKASEISPVETKVYLLRASAYRELGELQAAMKDVDKAMSCHRQHLEVETKRKQEQQLKRRHSKTDHEQQLVTVQDDRTREYHEITKQRNLILNDLALQFIRENSFQLALNAMNQVIQGETEITTRFHEPHINPQYYVNRGDAYRGLSNLHAALADYHHALELGPGNQEVRSRVALIHYQFGIDFFNQGQFPKAELEFAKAIAEDDSVSTYHVRKGDAARYQEKHHVACQDYLQAVKLNPSDSDTRNKLLQYAVDPLVQTPNRSGVNLSSNNNLANQSTERVLSPSRRSFDEQATSQASAISAALKSYKSKNKTVQELFLNRATLPPPKRTPLPE